MATVPVTQKNFETLIDRGVVLLDWWAAWCGPCRMFAPIYEAASGRHPDATFGKVDTEAEPVLSASFGIRAIPTLMVFREGILVFEHSGVLPGNVLDELLGKVKALDMEEVRRQIAASEPPAAPEA